MINWLVRHRMGPAFSLAAGLLLAIVVIAVSAGRLVAEYETARHTTEVLSELDGVLAAVSEAESARRAFRVTGDERDRAPYLAATAAAEQHLRALRTLAADVARRRRLDALESLVTAPGPRSIEAVRSVVASMKAEERRLLTEQSDRHARQARQVFFALAGLAGVTFVGLVVLVAEGRRGARDMRMTRAALRTQVAEHEKTSSLLASLVQSSDDAIIGLDLDGHVLTWNTGAERLYGFGADEARGRSIAMLFPPGREAEIAAALDRVRRGETIERLETEHVTKDGRRIHVLLTTSRIRDIADNLIGVSLASRDISAQQQAEELLRRSEATSRAFLESASESIVVADAGGRIVLINARTETMFGYARAELIGQPVELLVPVSHRERHVAHRATYMAAPRIRFMGQGLDLAGLKKDGTEFPVEVSLSYVHTDEGTRAIAFVTDISERLAFQRAARQADKLAALGTLSAGIAHEINNPIGIISSRVEVMLLEAEGGELPAELRKDLDVILRHARRVAAITQALLSFARQSSGAREPVNLNRVVQELVQLAQKDMSGARVEVTLKLDETLPGILADANAIGQVLLNLLTNARGAMPEGGEITIETGRLPAAGSVRLLVRDTGAGIPPEILPKIFDPFFTTKPDGTGLGLAISHGIVHDHHGTVAVRSEPGQGTTFTLTFPADAPGGA